MFMLRQILFTRVYSYSIMQLTAVIRSFFLLSWMKFISNEFYFCKKINVRYISARKHVYICYQVSFSVKN